MYIASSACSTPVTLDGFANCFDDDGVARHSQIVISTPNANTFIDILRMCIGKFRCETIDIVEIAVGFILMFLVELVSVEGVVVKFCGTRLKCQSNGFPRSINVGALAFPVNYLK